MYIPQELVEIILRHCPWRALVLSRWWLKWALQIIMAVPVHGIPHIHRQCSHKGAYNRLLAAAKSVRGRSHILARGKYVKFTYHGDSVHRIKFMTDRTVELEYLDGICIGALVGATV